MLPVKEEYEYVKLVAFVRMPMLVMSQVYVRLCVPV